jgi:DNA ligase (NAD+)
MSVSEFFAALDIEGKGTFEAIVSVPGLQTIDEILNAARGNNVQLLAKAERVSPTKARSIIDQINSRILEIESLKKRVKIKVAGTTLIGKGFCITGTLTQPRREIENKIKDAGGKVYSDVNSKTHYLICNETNSTSSKMKKAQQLRISVITEDTFNQMLT